MKMHELALGNFFAAWQRPDMIAIKLFALAHMAVIKIASTSASLHIIWWPAK